jgi:two-component system cell cycle response regulator
LEGAHTVAERIRERIGATPFSIHRGTRTVEITVSIGVAARRAEDGEADALLKRADLALYKAKGDGRDRVVAAAA